MDRSLLLCFCLVNFVSLSVAFLEHCEKTVYHADHHCFYEAGVHTLRACPNGTHFNHYSCSCLHDHSTLPTDTECLRAFHGDVTSGNHSYHHTSGSSSSWWHSGSSGSNSHHHVDTLTNHVCMDRSSSAFMSLYNLSVHQDQCMTARTAFNNLHKIRPVDCQYYVIDILYGVFGSKADSDNCACSGSVTAFTSSHYHSCQHYQAYATLFNRYYSTSHSTSHCLPHQSVWPLLHELKEESSTCTDEIIVYIGGSVSKAGDHCSCSTKAVVPNFRKCSQLETITAVGQSSYLSDPSAPCPSGGHSKSEATVFNLCSSPTNTSRWTKGLNVLQHCGDIPIYTAIGIFIGESYLTDSVAGVFLSCNTTDITLVTQSCDHPVEINTTNTEAPYYYTIGW